jgi:hypothetical protein
MKRRDFIKLSIAGSSALLMPRFGQAAPLDLSQIQFSQATFEANAAQTILVYLYGGASQVGGNLTNLDEIELHSQKSYREYFRNITLTANGCWQEAGGVDMEQMIADGDMTLYRTCYSQVREDADNKAHGVCTEQNQKGSFETDGGGVIANLAAILDAQGAVDDQTVMPFVTMEGESVFYAPGNVPLPGYLKPVGIDEAFDNPYARSSWTVRRWTYYTEAEREHEHYNESDEEGGFDPALTAEMDRIAREHNPQGKIREALERRSTLADFIEEVRTATTPDLGDNAYPEDNSFADKLEAAIKLLDKNPDTRIITLGSGGLGGWDDHNGARDYVDRMAALFRALRSAMAHLKALGKEETVNIMVFGEFGRNVNLNSAYGWDHGNLQNVYVLGGKRYFTHQGIVGETVVDNPSSLNRLWLKPKSGTYRFEPPSIASTLYAIYGIDNPEILTGGYGTVNVI